VRGTVLLDTGPLVAYLDRSDHFHDWAQEQFRQVKSPQLTCEAVLAEACHLLRKVPNAYQAVLDLVSRRAVSVPFRLEDELASVRHLIRRYASVPISLADACLIRMAEQHTNATVLTIDRDFRIYRKNGRQVVPAILPEELER
jgi:predicted nucleic acid-binding protein